LDGENKTVWVKGKFYKQGNRGCVCQTQKKNYFRKDVKPNLNTDIMKLLEGKVALITGGSRGIGAAICKKFAAHGCNVAFTYLSSEEKAKNLESELSGEGIEAKGYKSDASKFDQAEQLIADVLAQFGKIDILINNAGITRDTLMLRMTEEQWDQVMEINLKSVFNLTKHALKPMLKNRGGSIINMSSVVGVFGNAGQANYAASKAGIIGFSKSIAKEVGSRNIRCNAIAPGFIETEMTEVLDDKTKDSFLAGIPMKRLGQAEEVADVCVFLGSEMSTYISGQVISVCGALNT
jgi:3-oxoacyl-[acyl-carrier protein] reductase